MVFFYKEVINAEEKKKKCGELKTAKLLLLWMTNSVFSRPNGSFAF